MSLPWLLRVPANCRILGFVAVLVALTANHALAGLPLSESRTIPSANGKFLLVLLAPKEERNLPENPPIGISEEEIRGVARINTKRTTNRSVLPAKRAVSKRRFQGFALANSLLDHL